MNKYKILSTKKIGDHEIEIDALVEKDEFLSHFNEELKKIQKEASMPGFRQGHIPENILISKVGETSIVENAADDALSIYVPKIISDEKINLSGRPRVSVTKIAKDNPLEFKIRIPVLPKMELGDYKKVIKELGLNKTNKKEVSEKEINEAVENIVKDRLGLKHEDKAPELTDKLALEISGFENVNKFKSAISDYLKKENDRKEKEKNRIKISENILKNIEFEISEILTDDEVESMESQFLSDLKRMKISYEDYLSKSNKKREDILKEWRPEAVKSVKLRFILRKIAEEEKISNSEEEIKKEVDHILQHHKEIDIAKARAYVDDVLKNEKVFSLLESL